MKKLILVGVAALCTAGLQATTHQQTIPGNGTSTCESAVIQAQPCEASLMREEVIVKPATARCVCPQVICRCKTQAYGEIVCKPSCAPKPACSHERPCGKPACHSCGHNRHHRN